MNWIFLAVIAQFFNAVVAVIDKRIVSDENILPRPFVYAFYSCLLSGVWILLYMFSLVPSLESLHLPSFAHVVRPTLEVVALSFLSAYTFFTALVSMFSALREADAADVVPVIGATSAIVSFVLGHFFLGAEMGAHFAMGVIILAVGTALVSHFNFKFGIGLQTLHAGIFFAFHYIAIKGLFSVTSFDDGFFWSRIAFVVFALLLLLIPASLKKITEQTKVTTPRAGVIVFGNKVFASISTFLVLKATDLGDVAVVQALGGLQFVFIFLIGIFFTLCPDKSRNCEMYHRDSILRKALFIAVIVIGFLVLYSDNVKESISNYTRTLSSLSQSCDTRHDTCS